LLLPDLAVTVPEVTGVAGAADAPVSGFGADGVGAGAGGSVVVGGAGAGGV